MILKITKEEHDLMQAALHYASLYLEDYAKAWDNVLDSEIAKKSRDRAKLFDKLRKKIA